MKRLGIALIVLALAVSMVSAIEELCGPVAVVEEWDYRMETTFGETEEVWSSHRKLIYDEWMNPVEEIHYAETGNVRKRIVRAVDNKGRVVQIDEYDAAGELFKRTTREHDGLIQHVRVYGSLLPPHPRIPSLQSDERGPLIAARKGEVDREGQLLSLTTYDVETGTEKAVIRVTYDQEGRPVSTSSERDGELESRTDYSYDVEGMDRVEQSTFYGEMADMLSIEAGDSTIYGVQLEGKDDQGNWTVRYHYRREERFGRVEWVLWRTTRRVISYGDQPPMSDGNSSPAVPSQH